MKQKQLSLNILPFIIDSIDSIFIYIAFILNLFKLFLKMGFWGFGVLGEIVAFICVH